MKDIGAATWTFYSGNAGHGLDAGLKLVSRGSNEATAQTNYWLTVKDSDGKAIALLPTHTSARTVRVYVNDATTTTFYEFKPSTFLLADEMTTGELRITNQFLKPPIIRVIQNNLDRIKIGNFQSSYYGMVGYANDGTTKIFELSDYQRMIAGWQFTDTSFSKIVANAGITISSSVPKLSITDSGSVERVLLGNYGAGYGLVLRGADGSVIFNNAIASASLAGWSIDKYRLMASGGAVGFNSEVTAGVDWRFWAGSATPSSAPFRVDENGNMVASSATITGSISATSGTIGGWSVDGSRLYNGAI
jgi:hypothetical protein